MTENSILEHIPVLFQEVKELYQSRPRQTVIDATLGLGWHAYMLIEWLDEWGTFVGFERDDENLEIAKKHLAEISKGKNVHLVRESFAAIEETFHNLSIDGADFILYDLWVSSAHYDDGDRGFSIRHNAPLDMRFDRTSGNSVQNMIERLPSRELMHIFQEYGEEKKAYFIAEAIVKARALKKIESTQDLLEIISASSFDKKSPIRVFQALRIAINDEFGHIKKSLDSVSKKMNIGWQIAVITFHSLEDRLVKNIFSELCSSPIDQITGRELEPPKFKKVIKKPIEPREDELHKNPRSRSAKLRIIEKINL